MQPFPWGSAGAAGAFVSLHPSCPAATLSCNILIFILFFFPKQQPGVRRKCPLNHFFPKGQPKQRGLRCRLCCSSGRAPACSVVRNRCLPLPRASCGFCLAGGWGVPSPPRTENNMARHHVASVPHAGDRFACMSPCPGRGSAPSAHCRLVVSRAR